MSEETKKVSGLRSAVRYGKLTVEQAFAKLKGCDYVSEDLVRWLHNFKRRGAKPVETVETTEC